MSGLLSRLARLFYAPTAVMEELKESPRWLGPVLVGAGLVLLASVLIPKEMMLEAARLQQIRAGNEAPENMERMVGVMRTVSLVATPIFWFVWNFFLAGVVTVMFAFLLGDEGTFRQYLSVVAHAMFVGAVGALLTTPLRIQAQDLYLTLSVGTFAQGFMPDGYWLRVLQALDLFGLWSYGLIALGASVLDRRRRWGGAFLALLIFAVGIAMLIALVRR
ncbi:MAG: YIP1 family protein [Longimicrobiales bacterium]